MMCDCPARPGEPACGNAALSDRQRLAACTFFELAELIAGCHLLRLCPAKARFLQLHAEIRTGVRVARDGSREWLRPCEHAGILSLN